MKEIISTIEIDHEGDKKEYTFGRSLENDIYVNSPIVSGSHGTFKVRGNKLVLTDKNSTNGIFVNGQKIQEIELNNGDNIRIDSKEGNHEKGVLIVYSSVEGQQVERWTTLSLNNKNEVTIGRALGNDILMDSKAASKNHAKITKVQGEFYIEDFSTNGTYLNGARVTKKERLKENDVIVAGDTKIIFKEGSLVYNVYSKGIQLDAQNITKIVSDGNGGEKKILDDISISIKPGELVALIGGSGAGKSTFMDSLNGFRMPTSGTVLINNDNFYENYNAYKNILGYVPQQDIVYDSLTVEEMLTYSAQLRMPEDSTKEDIRERVAEVIRDVELEGREKLLISKLSGGQKKRASIAVELLADPKLFYLDEPTSGLDPGMERNLMKLLRKLANQGKTIILITHATANLHLCDKVVFLGYGGRLCYFGPPKGALTFFGVEDYVDIYDNLGEKQAEKWKQKFKASDYGVYQKQLSAKTPKKIKKEKVTKRSSLKQFSILSRRYVKLIAKDRAKTILLLAQVPVIISLLAIVAKKDSFSSFDDAKSIIFTLACAAVWLGVLNSIQEICKERVIYKRERAVNLKIAPYIASKLFILGLVCIIQAISLVGLTAVFIDFPGKGLLPNLYLEVFLSVFLITFVSVALGLVISTFFKNPDAAMSAAPVILVPQLLFTGLVFELKGVSDIISSFALSKWASRVLAVSFDLNNIPLKIAVENPKLPIPPRDLPQYYDQTFTQLTTNWAILGGILVVCIIISVVMLMKQDEE
jgi:ABC-type multidrug transport system ATPase subunit